MRKIPPFFLPSPSRILSATVAVAMLSVAWAGAQPIYQQRFNEASDIELLKGAELGPAGSGVSGLPADKAYLAKVESAPNAVALINSLPESREAEEITVTAWYKPQGDIADATTLFSAFGSVLIWDAKTRQWVWRIETSPSSPDTSKSPYWFYSGVKTSAYWTAEGEWTYIALVWKRQTGQASFYHGSKVTESLLVHEMTRTSEVNPLVMSGNTKNVTGNDRYKMDRTFSGEIDNVRFFATALDESQIEAIRNADLANRPIKNE